MEPKYPVGSIVMVAPVDPQQVAVGDVISFATEGKRVTHRVMAISEEAGGRSFVTKGDANDVNDSTSVQSASIIGRVRGDIPWAGVVFSWASTPLGMGLLAGGLVALLLLGVLGRSASSSSHKLKPAALA